MRRRRGSLGRSWRPGREGDPRRLLARPRHLPSGWRGLRRPVSGLGVGGEGGRGRAGAADRERLSARRESRCPPRSARAARYPASLLGPEAPRLAPEGSARGRAHLRRERELPGSP